MRDKNMEKNHYGNLILGITVNIILFLAVYVIPAVYLWKILKGVKMKFLIFIILYVLIIYLLKYIITLIYKELTKKNLFDEIDDFIYGINNRNKWGGLILRTTSFDDKKIYKLLKEQLKTYKQMEKNYEVEKKIVEIENKLNELESVIMTGGTIFEGLFCIKKILNKNIFDDKFKKYR